MPPRKVLIVEDEAIIGEHLRRILLRLGYRVSGVASRGELALERLRHDPPDLVLLDIMLPGALDGIDLASRLRAEYRIPFVFITSLTDQATVARATQTRPYGYLVKPFEERGVYVALEMAFAAFDAEQAAPPAPAVPVPAGPDGHFADSLFVRERSHLAKVPFREVLWLRAEGNYTAIHTRSTQYTISNTLKQVEEQLPAADFLRVHKSYVVALPQLAALDGQQLVLAGGQRIPVGRAYRAALLGRLRPTGPAK